MLNPLDTNWETLKANPTNRGGKYSELIKYARVKAPPIPIMQILNEVVMSQASLKKMSPNPAANEITNQLMMFGLLCKNLDAMIDTIFPEIPAIAIIALFKNTFPPKYFV